MEFFIQALAATILSTLTLAVECAGMAVLIHLAQAYFARGVKTKSLWHTAVLMIRFTSMTILLHLLQILLWTAFYPRAMLPIVGILLLFLGDQLLHRGVRRHCPSASLATAWTGRGDHGCFDVWNFRKCAVCHCGAANRKRGTVRGGSPVSAESKNSASRLIGSQFGKNFADQRSRFSS